MSQSIFDRIVRGEIPCCKVYEDDRVFAFLDINPLSKGHTLVIPKHGVERLHQLPTEDAEALGRALPRIAKAVLAATGAVDYNVLQNNGEAASQSVMHVHFHIIPRFPGDAAAGLEMRWNAGSLEPEAGNALAAEIASKL